MNERFLLGNHSGQKEVAHFLTSDGCSKAGDSVRVREVRGVREDSAPHNVAERWCRGLITACVHGCVQSAEVNSQKSTAMPSARHPVEF